MLKNTDQFYDSKEEPNKSCLLALRSILTQHHEHIAETKKYGMPCFCYKDKAICYLWVDKCSNHPYLLMVHGMEIEHPQLEQGERKRMKIFRVNPNEDIPMEDIAYLLNESIKIQESKIK